MLHLITTMKLIMVIPVTLTPKLCSILENGTRCTQVNKVSITHKL
jgi:hypothetical protein